MSEPDAELAEIRGWLAQDYPGLGTCPTPGQIRRLMARLDAETARADAAEARVRQLDWKIRNAMRELDAE